MWDKSQNVRHTGYQKKWFMLAGCCLLLALSHIGCGIKGPPVPPKAPPIQAVTDLSYQVDEGSVVLAWGLPDRLSGKRAKGSVFDIYRSRSELSDAACEDCPLIFEKVATLPYVQTDNNRFSIALDLDPGYRYVFKVRLVTNGQAGADTEPVRFDFPSDESSAGTETP